MANIPWRYGIYLGRRAATFVGGENFTHMNKIFSRSKQYLIDTNPVSLLVSAQTMENKSNVLAHQAILERNRSTIVSAGTSVKATIYGS
jgi:hypothetical protein